MSSKLIQKAGLAGNAWKCLGWTVKNIVGNLLMVANFFLAFAAEERCRLCETYIDMLGWLNEFIPEDAAMPAELEGSTRSMAICNSCWKQLIKSSSILSQFTVDSPNVLILNDDASGFSNVRELVVRSGIGYTDQLKKLVRKFKYDKDLLLTLPLSCLAIRAWQPEPDEPNNLILVPVPLHWRRKSERGYNQSALLAKVIGKRLSIPVSEKALSRKKFTKPQNKLSRPERRDNLVCAFRGNERILRGVNVVLIDDVCTSGATLLECAREAYNCGAKSVCALTVARAVLMHKLDSQHEFKA